MTPSENHLVNKRPPSWGTVNLVTRIAPGLIIVDCASHGGLGLTEDRNQDIPASIRAEDGWYEEDLAIAIPMLAFRDEIKAWRDARHNDGALYLRGCENALLNGYPEAWEILTGGKATPDNSEAVRRQQFEQEHATDWTIRTAFGFSESASDRQGVPRGMTGVIAYQTGRVSPEGHPLNLRSFLIPQAEYARAASNGYVIDLTLAQPVPQGTLGFGADLSTAYRRLPAKLTIQGEQSVDLWAWESAGGDPEMLQLRMVGSAEPGVDLVLTQTQEQWISLLSGQEPELADWRAAASEAALEGLLDNALPREQAPYEDAPALG